jgi:hypothetical protein
MGGNRVIEMLNLDLGGNCLQNMHINFVRSQPVSKTQDRLKLTMVELVHRGACFID